MLSRPFCVRNFNGAYRPFWRPLCHRPSLPPAGGDGGMPCTCIRIIGQWEEADPTGRERRKRPWLGSSSWAVVHHITRPFRRPPHPHPLLPPGAGGRGVPSACTGTISQRGEAVAAGRGRRKWPWLGPSSWCS